MILVLLLPLVHLMYLEKKWYLLMVILKNNFKDDFQVEISVFEFPKDAFHISFGVPMYVQYIVCVLG